MYEGICDAIHRELSRLDEKYANGTQITGSELAHIDMMAHTLKSLAAYDAMKYEDSYQRRDRYRRY